MIKEVEIVKKITIVILPKKGVSPSEQLGDCLFQLNEKLDNFNLDKKSVLKQHVFLREDRKNNFLQKRDLFQDILDRYYVRNTPPTSIIAQAHANEIEVAMEITLAINNDPKIEIENKSVGNINYKVIRNSDFTEVFACGLTSSDLSIDISKQTEIAFTKMKEILDNENLDFSNVVRQWNYIEDILRIGGENSKSQQNYQIFNDVRTKYYKRAEFVNGYPAATGIGMDTGGVLIDFIASSRDKNISVNSIKNPRQTDAHLYSKKVLIGDENAKKTSPKFERAKVVSSQNSGEIYISGTAAIRGERTVEEQEIVSQVQTTIGNINELISINNLKKNGVSLFDKQVMISSLRVYVRYEQDINKVADVCKQYFPKIPTLYLIADICRNNLLVEIEGKAIF
jgi:enamine deaminase RidA (YjgF/YER057c/UK114 family)